MLALFPSLESALTLLLQESGALESDSKLSRKPLGVPLAELCQQGVELDDLRWLFAKGLIIDFSRRFPDNGHAASGGNHATALCQGAQLCLTDAGIELALQLVAADLQTPERANQALQPSWDQETRELYFGSNLVKKFRQPAPTQEMILAVFEEEQWPAHIDDPLPRPPDGHAPERLHAAVRNLNSHQRRRLIQFECDGHGEGICWHPRHDGR